MSLLSLGLLCAPLLWTQSSTDRLTVGQPQKIVGKRNQSVQTRIPLSILSGYHVNSNPPSDTYLIPLKIEWQSLGALEGGKVTYPKPEKIPVAGKDVTVYTGNIDLIANFKVSPTAPAGLGAVDGKLTYQACNSNTCFPPKTLDVAIPYQIQ